MTADKPPKPSESATESEALHHLFSVNSARHQQEKAEADAKLSTLERLAREAKTLSARITYEAEQSAQTVQFWSNPADTSPYLHGDPLPPLPDTDEETVGVAQAILHNLRRSLAALQGFQSVADRDEVGLVWLVSKASSFCEKSMVFAAQDGCNFPSDFHHPTESVSFFLISIQAVVSEPTAETLQKPENRVLLVEAVEIKLGLKRRIHERSPKAPTWLYPLFDVACNAGLARKAGDAESWYRKLRGWGVPFAEKSEEDGVL